jgi:hypothetical protein
MNPARIKTSRHRKVTATFTPAFIAAARASSQATFEHSDRLPDDDGFVFVTNVDDAPLQILGRLGSDGRWYVGKFIVAPLDMEDPHPPSLNGMIVLRDEPVAERMVRHGIDRLLNAAIAGRAPQGKGFAAFTARLRTSRFRKSVD